MYYIFQKYQHILQTDEPCWLHLVQLRQTTSRQPQLTRQQH
jgi:hypothetical protein